MKCFLVACCSLIFSCPFSRAQGTIASPNAVQSDTQSTCARCSPKLAPLKDQNDAELSATNRVLPDSPGSTVPAMPDTFVWSLTEPTQQPTMAPPRVPIWDKKMWAANIVFAGAIIFDVESTHQGIAHHRCVEGNTDLSKKPSRGELYGNNLEVFIPIVVMAASGALAGRSAHLPRWAWKAMGYIGPGIGTFKHLSGGIHWYTRCW